MPDRLPSLIYLVGCWVPPALIGLAAANVVHRSTARISPPVIYAALAAAAIAWSATWYQFHLTRIPPYVPGATHDPTYAPPEAVAGLAVVAGAVVLPASLLACMLAFRRRARTLKRA